MRITNLMLIMLLFNLCSLSISAQRLTAGQKIGKSFVIAYPKRGEINRLDLVNAKAEIVNGKLNIVFILADGAMLQINGVPQSWLKDTACNTSNIQMVYISANQETTLVSRNSLKLSIRCAHAQPGAPLAIYVLGRVNKSNQSNTFETQYYGTVPKAEFMGTNNIKTE